MSKFLNIKNLQLFIQKLRIRNQKFYFGFEYLSNGERTKPIKPEIKPVMVKTPININNKPINLQPKREPPEVASLSSKNWMAPKKPKTASDLIVMKKPAMVKIRPITNDIFFSLAKDFKFSN